MRLHTSFVGDDLSVKIELNQLGVVYRARAEPKYLVTVHFLDSVKYTDPTGYTVDLEDGSSWLAKVEEVVAWVKKYAGENVEKISIEVLQAYQLANKYTPDRLTKQYNTHSHTHSVAFDDCHTLGNAQTMQTRAALNVKAGPLAKNNNNNINVL